MVWLAFNYDMGSIRRFCAPRMVLNVLMMVRGRNNVPQVLHIYFYDPIHKVGLKDLTFELDMGAYKIFFILGMDPWVMIMIEEKVGHVI